MLLAALLVAPLAVAGQAAAADDGRDWRFVEDTKGVLPAAVRGTACSATDTFARTRWRTVLHCSAYVTRTGRAAHHWSYIVVDINSATECTTDGYQWGEGGSVYAPDQCHGFGNPLSRERLRFPG